MGESSRCFPLMRLFAAAALLWTGSPGGDQARADWPQWRGPNRDGISPEQGLLQAWPESGPEVVWRVPLEAGFSGVSVRRGRLYTMGAAGKVEYALCLEAASGAELWRAPVGEKFTNGNGDGPRSTPALGGDQVFVVGAQGTLCALRAEDGTKLWERDFVKEFGTAVPGFGFSPSPLIEGDMVLSEVGGGEGKSLAAFDRNSGKVLWTVHTDRAGYSSPIAITWGGVRQILFLTSNNLVSVAPADGRVHWTYPWPTHDGINVATPIFIPGGMVFISASYDHGAALVEMKAENGALAAVKKWESKVMKNHFNSSVLRGDYLYGFDDAVLKCIEAKTGETQWAEKGLGKGSLLLAEGHLVVLSDAGKLVLVEARPERYEQKASAQVLEGTCWTVPSLADGRLYLRNQAELLCLDVTAP